jgi:regulator of sigma D
MYSMYYTRPDIDFSIWKLSRYTSKPNTDHWKAIAKVFGYLKRTIDLDLFYFDSLVVLEGYYDTSERTSLSDNKSTLEWIFSLEEGAISWVFKK